MSIANSARSPACRTLGLNFRDLVYERHGLKDRLTDQFPARVVREVLA